MKKQNLRFELLALCLVLFPIVYALSVYDQIPETMVTHYNIKGEPDGFQEKNFVYFLILPGVSFMLNLVLASIPALMPEEDQKASTLRMIQATRIATLLLLGGIAISMVQTTDGRSPDYLFRWLGGGIFLLTLLLGNYMKEIKTNEFAGMRNRFTLSDPEVWKVTHRRSSYWFFYSGLVGLIATVFIETPILFGASLFILIGLCLMSWKISASEFRKRNPEQ
ncbi:DUF1648 domain-containing protein [Cryomorphaceae bacterium]|nr:DUF1648 domain-containing protein [Cryomorphaceae bacterium]